MGFNWLSYYHLYQAFADKITNYDNGGFNWFKNFAYDWTHTWTYGLDIKKVAVAIGAVIGSLPLPIVYLFGIGFACSLFLVVLRIVIDLL